MILIMQGQPGGCDRYMEGAWHGRGCAMRAVFFNLFVFLGGFDNVDVSRRR